MWMYCVQLTCVLHLDLILFFLKQKTAYELRISDWSSDVCSSDLAAAISQAPHRLRGELHLGGQDHFYLEGQVSLAEPREDGDMMVRCSTQHPSEVQKMVARVLDRPLNAVTVECRRMGGGFGGKETQAAQFACIAAVFVARNS